MLAAGSLLPLLLEEPSPDLAGGGVALLALFSGAVVLGLLPLATAGFLLAVIETISAKLRIFRAPEFLATAFLFAVLGLLVHLLLGA